MENTQVFCRLLCNKVKSSLPETLVYVGLVPFEFCTIYSLKIKTPCLNAAADAMTTTDFLEQLRGAILSSIPLIFHITYLAHMFR